MALRRLQGDVGGDGCRISRPSINVPVLIVAGLGDKIVSVGAMEAMAGELRAGALAILPGARHELMMERDSLREQFWAAFDAFVPGS